MTGSRSGPSGVGVPLSGGARSLGSRKVGEFLGIPTAFFPKITGCHYLKGGYKGSYISKSLILLDCNYCHYCNYCNYLVL